MLHNHIEYLSYANFAEQQKKYLDWISLKSVLWILNDYDSLKQVHFTKYSK